MNYDLRMKNKLNKEKIYNKLKKIIDPELDINIVDLGLIYNIKIDQKNSKIEIDMTLTSQGCPLADFFQEEVKKVIKEIDEAYNVKVNLVWEPAWSPDRISNKIKKELKLT